MSPPAYSDLGKNAKDVFNKGYNDGLWKLELKTKTDSGVEFTTSGNSQQETGKVSGGLETKYKVKEYGLTFSEKWNTDNTLASEVAVENQLVKGLKLSLAGTFAPAKGTKSGIFKTSYSHERVRLDGDATLNLTDPILGASAVIGYQGWLAGYQLGYEVKTSVLKNNNFALGYTAGDFVLHTSVTNGKTFSGSIYQRCNDRLETAVNLSWASGEASKDAKTNSTQFGIAAKYVLDKDASVRAKVDIESKIGLGYQQKLRDGITLSLSTQIDAKNFNSGGHKVGAALELEA